MDSVIRILFVCHGNYCRSPMAEFLFRDMVQKEGLGDHFIIASAATHHDDLGSPPHYEVTRILRDQGIRTDGKVAVLLTRKDYRNYDYIIGMDHKNLKEIRRIVGSDPEGKVCLLLDFTDHPRDISDPWLTRNYEKAYADIKMGCECLLQYLKTSHQV